MLQKFVKFVEEKVAPPLMAIAQNRVILAIRDSFVSVMPLIAVGSLFLLAAFAPIPGWMDIVAPHAGKIVMGFSMTFGILSLYLAFSLGYSLANAYNLNPLPQGLMSAMAFLFLAAPMEEGVIPTAFLGGTGIFTALIASFFVIFVSRFFQKRGLVVRMPEGVPPFIAAAFEVVFSLAFILLVVWFLRIWLEFNLAEFIQNLFAPIVVASDTLPAVIVESLLVMILWFLGIHGHSIAAWNVGILASFSVANLTENATAFAAGLPIPNIVTPAFRSFFQVGVTSTIPICLILLLRKNQQLKQVGRLSLLPGIFGVTEPIWFGLPIVLNPYFLIPFVVSDVLGLSLTWLVMKWNIVPRVVSEVHWAMPAPIGAFLATGGSWVAVIWFFILMALATLIFYPFLIAYERSLEKKDNA